ncbi:hypothetical protein PLICRDRAFT_145693 [Plicaturopsis crispa FD-325 SS-3]|uniref:PIN domain-like protein n=1 Tax=Plicaturopsis crispa FD-325 SS-3 TaxID=944288 RepID=A0A0C9T9U2_PLICR|nr:hypothetical protein PLICRDRAFT_145693 [Plicaturopsis crispa FD-325 SS-3]
MGVKSLWQLLTPVGRPVSLETVEGRTMAIDSSIWLYQFQATMRDKEGRVLVNAPLLGFLRRICKLLFYGIKPVFVFDGGAPVLKRATITERKNKKSGAAASHAKVAEKLLAAQLRREAVNAAQGERTASKGKSKARVEPVTLDDDTVYLEDIDGSAPKTPARTKDKGKTATSTPTSSAKKNRFHDHDPYRLPDVDLDEVIARATRAEVPDPRLATEDELQAFIDDMRPEDFDVTSPAFRELPTEVQYEIIGDLRLKSRQTSYQRLQNMLKHAPTPLDFSKQQILNLKQRNSLTQQLLVTTDSVGKAHLTIPVRVASERNREYVLMKNEGKDGGWILGIRDEGKTQEKPIKIDLDDEKGEESSDDMEMEEVTIPQPGTYDPDLREYQRGMALSAITQRSGHNHRAPSKTKPIRRQSTKKQPLFQPSDDEDDDALPIHRAEPQDSDDDLELATAIAESLENSRARADESVGQSSTMVSSSHTHEPLHAVDAPLPPQTPSRSLLERVPSSSALGTSSQKISPTHYAPRLEDHSNVQSPSRLDIALSIGNAGPSWRASQAAPFGQPRILAPAPVATETAQSMTGSTRSDDDDDEDMEEVPVVSAPVQTHVLSEATPVSPPQPMAILDPEPSSDLEEVEVLSHQKSLSPHGRMSPQPQSTSATPSIQTPSLLPPAASGGSHSRPSLSGEEELILLTPPSKKHDLLSSALRGPPQIEDEEHFTDWSRSPSPFADPSGGVADSSKPVEAEDWDAAQEMDVDAEEIEFAQFMSNVKGKDLDDVRREIDDEIKSLNKQKKVAMRDSEDVTQQTISLIMVMLRLFGIPYITAPMEAEAQCAELVSLGLVEGIITDDSDVFLFGGKRVFKNMFNQSKTVECFVLSDLSRELGLDRDTLVRLAYLLGSDYVDGLPGVGPVIAMELLKEFPGEDGLHKFKDWWLKVQSGKDRPDETNTPFRKRFKKKFKDLYLPAEWPNAAVRDAYYHPTVDSSDEPFKWGLPDLDALRDFFREELGWNQGKVDETLLPIIQRMGKRGQAAALNKQGNLNDFFDVSAGTGNLAPRHRQAYSSKRLQEVVNDFRKRKAGRSSATPEQLSDEDAPPRKKTKTAGKGRATARGKGKARASNEPDGTASTSKKAPSRGRGRGRGRARGARTAANLGSRSTVEPGSGDDADVYESKPPAEGAPDPPPLAVQLRPRPKPRWKEKQDHSGSEHDMETADSA